MSGLDDQKPSRRLWIFAAVIALALHVGGAALAIVQLQAEESDDALGASAIEVGLELVNRASGAAGRLLSRDLDRTHVSSGQRGRGAAE